jgi:hypothetical protein
MTQGMQTAGQNRGPAEFFNTIGQEQPLTDGRFEASQLMKWTRLGYQVFETEIDRFSTRGTGELMIIEVIPLAFVRV